MSRGKVMAPCRCQLLVYGLCALLIFLLIHVINSGLSLNFRGDVEVVTPMSFNSSNLPPASTTGVNMKEFAAVLARYASRDHWVVLSLIDQGCVDMAVNLHVTSLKPLGIENYLFVGQDAGTCAFVQTYNINCYVYVTDAAASRSSVYQSKDFLRKMNIRTYMILDALNLGYSVLHTDVDMNFLASPLVDFSYTANDYDVAPLWDCGAHNAGFLFIRNSRAARGMYAVMKHIADTEPHTDDQKALNRAITKAKRTLGLRLRSLNRDKYLCGETYWEKGHRDFAGDNPCASCVVVHDNWIVSMEAKRYRLQESGLWAYDGPHRYYSCPERRYLTYGNTVWSGEEAGTEKLELEALQAALTLGALLNRTVILPRFHCGAAGERACNLLHHLLVRKLDAHFHDAYRESTFLSNPLVPADLSSSQSPLYLIDSQPAAALLSRLDLEQVSFFRPQDYQKGASAREVREWFASRSDKVLRFHSLYAALCCYNDYRLGPGFEQKLIESLSTKGNYRQFDK